MDINNFVYYQKGGKVMSLGYEVDCKMMNNDLSVPAGLFILNNSIQSNTNNVKDLFENLETEKEVINDELYDKLLGLMTPKKSKKDIIKKSKRNTRRKLKKTKSRRKTRTKRK
jgi:hypothetical protein